MSTLYLAIGTAYIVAGIVKCMARHHEAEEALLDIFVGSCYMCTIFVHYIPIVR